MFSNQRKKRTPLQKVKDELEKVSHDYIRRRDSISNEKIAGYCIDCGKYAEGQHFQAGHFEASGSCGAILRYHPMNMHGQASGCNMLRSQERVKIEYTMRMIKKYGKARVDKLRQLKNRSIKADIIFHTKLLELYKEGNESKIISFLENYH